MKHLLNVRDASNGGVSDPLHCRVLQTYETTVTPQEGSSIVVEGILTKVQQVIISPLPYPPEPGGDPLQVDVLVYLPIRPNLIQ